MLEINQNLIIFDYYYEKNAFDRKKFTDYLKTKPNTDIYYIVTHGHHDHFSEEIFSPSHQSSKGTTRYILSEDLKEYKGINSNITFCKPYDKLTIGSLNIKTFGSTDQGVSYLVEVIGSEKLIFHSGDLNWWHWKSFSPDEKLQEKKDYLQELEKIKAYLFQNNLTIDIAFVPVDPRLEEFYNLAGNAFIDEIKPKKIFPLHFRNEYEVTTEFQNQCQIPGVFQSVNHPMETFILSD